MPVRINSAKNEALSLIELLVVIAIIAILASVLLAALSGAKEQGATTYCANNLHELGLAMQTYGDDCNSWLPPSLTDISLHTGSWFNSWPKTMVAYYNNTNVLRCPSLSKTYSQSGFSYFMGNVGTTFADGPTTDPDGGFGVILTTIVTQSSYVLSGDCNYPTIPENADLNNLWGIDTLFDPSYAPKIHSRRVNVLFPDWHVKAYGKFNPGEMTYSLSLRGVPYP